jgi:hypothetical protein
VKIRFVAIASLLVIFAVTALHQQVAYGQITSPANNSFLIAGSNQEIVWKVSSDSTSLVVLQYSTDAGYSWNYVASTGIAAGSYNWVIPLSTNAYRCRVRLVKFTASGCIQIATSGNFSIASLDPSSQISAVFSHRVMVLADTSGHHFNRVQFFK